MTRHTPDETRALLTALYQAAVQGAAPLERTADAVRAWWQVHAPTPPPPVHVLALGKASVAMVCGAVTALRDCGVAMTHAVVVCAENPEDVVWPPDIPRDRLDVVRGDHPVPGPASLDAADLLEDRLREIEPGAIVIVLLSGGTTALCAAPIPRLSQEVGDVERAQAHVANLAQTLLESGLAIHEMNAIRRRVLRFGAGRLAVALAQRNVSAIATFAISDVIGDDPAVIGSGPCSPDPLDDAALLALIDAHDLRPSLERAVGTVLGLEGGGTPVAVPSAHDAAFTRVQYTLVARNRDALDAMQAHALAQDAHVILDPTPLEGEAATLGEALVHHALAMAPDVPDGSTLVLLRGGEPVVHLRAMLERAMQEGDADDARLADYGTPGAPLETRRSLADEPLLGGRMQVLALSAALALEEAAMRGHPHAWRIIVLAAGTDGRDGPTDAAGGIVDAAVPALARRARRSPERDLQTGHSWFSLREADALLRTGLTGTNAMDVVAVLIR